MKQLLLSLMHEMRGSSHFAYYISVAFQQKGNDGTYFKLKNNQSYQVASSFSLRLGFFKICQCCFLKIQAIFFFVSVRLTSAAIFLFPFIFFVASIIFFDFSSFYFLYNWFIASTFFYFLVIVVAIVNLFKRAM